MFERIKEIRALVLCARGHDPVITLKSSHSTVLGATHYLTSCKRCGRVYEEKVQQA